MQLFYKIETEAPRIPRKSRGTTDDRLLRDVEMLQKTHQGPNPLLLSNNALKASAFKGGLNK